MSFSTRQIAVTPALVGCKIAAEIYHGVLRTAVVGKMKQLSASVIVGIGRPQYVVLVRVHVV